MTAVEAGRRAGALPALLEAAEERGPLTAPEITVLLDREAVLVEFSSDWRVGD